MSGGFTLPRDLRLPAPAVDALADLVAAGRSVSEALRVLPRHLLKPKTAAHLDRELETLEVGESLAEVLEGLGLDVTAATLRGAQSRPEALEAALRADAAARAAESGMLAKVTSSLGLFVVGIAALVLVVLFLSLVVVPGMLDDVTAGLPEGDELPRALARFESFRSLWLGLAGGFFLLLGALVLAQAALVGRDGWRPFLHELRLRLPFLRTHAVHAAGARLLETLAHERAVGIPANRTLRRLARREPVPGLRDDLLRAASRLEAGNPWESCFRGTHFDTPELTGPVSLTGQGAGAGESWKWAASQSRERSVKALRRAVVTGAVVVLVPSVLYALLMLHVASTTALVAQLEGARQEIETITEEIESLIGEGPMGLPER